jgi:hypothetical protein
LTPDLYARADWLAACRMATVAMASTGVSWMPVSEMLDARGCRVPLVQARHLTHVPGRQRDVKDCQWMQSWQIWGLLSGSCRPEAERCAVRASWRHRAAWLEYRAAPMQPRHKARHQRNVQLAQVLTDLTGATGLAMLRAMVAGERDPVQLARFRAPRWASSTEDIAKALPGHDPPEHVLALKQALTLYDVDTEPGRECDAAIERRFQAIKPVGPDALPPLNRAHQHRTHHKHAPDDDARGLLYQLTGVDLVAIPGLHASPVHTMLAEIGLDPRKWPNAKAFCSWLGLAPHHEISGGKVLRRRTLRTRNRAGQAFRLAAPAVSRSHNGLGAYYRRMRARQGPKAAIVATAHKIACIVYHRLTHRTPCRDLRAADDEQRARERDLANLRKRAATRGLTLVESPAGSPKV